MSTQPFEIGLVGAGAISAGAYTAGVLDFMVQALDAWYAAKSGDPSIPQHDVKLAVFSGASAGAIAAALGAAYLASRQPPVRTEAEGDANNQRNKLWDSWVDRIDIRSLLEDRDLEADDARVVSLLDSSVLSEIAESGLDVQVPGQRRPYVAEPFDLLLTVTNTRGVPYNISLKGAFRAGHTMSLHADYVHFRFSDRGDTKQPDRYAMAWSDLGKDGPGKARLAQAALASGAFPLGLAPRTLSHSISGKPDMYSAREWRVPTPDSLGPHNCFSNQGIDAAWGTLPDPYKYDFLCVDGGVMNNEPLELARRLLAGPGGHNQRKSNAASKALLLIDPFPSDSGFTQQHESPPDLFKTLLTLFGALKNQARFKPEELALAAHDDIYSRFMVAPSRGDSRFPIACGSLGGFGGFLKRDFRKHDFFLGRRNAQKFLADHFVLAEDNPLFDPAWVRQFGAAYFVRKGENGPFDTDERGKRLLPIIPRVGDALPECFSPKWPTYTEADLEALSARLEKRVDVVVDRLLDQYFDNWLMRTGAKLFLTGKKSELRDYVLEKIAKELAAMGLMQPREPVAVPHPVPAGDG